MRTDRIVSRWATRAAGALALVCMPTVALAGWTPWCSEETAPVECPPGQAATGIQCSGDYCDNVSLYCSSATGGVSFVPNAEWSPWFSEELGSGFFGAWANRHLCTFGNSMGVVTGIRCSGDYCDNVSVRCAKVVRATPQGISDVPVSINSCNWTNPISEETPSYVSWTNFMSGVLCLGDYCDDKQLLYCGW